MKTRPLLPLPEVWRELDEWLRHRLRAIQLKLWKRSAAIYRGLKALGATDAGAKSATGRIVKPHVIPRAE